MQQVPPSDREAETSDVDQGLHAGLMAIGIVSSVDTEVLARDMKTVLDGNVEYLQLDLALKAVGERPDHSSAEDWAGIVSRNDQNHRKCQGEREHRPDKPPASVARSFCRCKDLGMKRHLCLELLGG